MRWVSGVPRYTPVSLLFMRRAQHSNKQESADLQFKAGFSDWTDLFDIIQFRLDKTLARGERFSSSLNSPEILVKSQN